MEKPLPTLIKDHSFSSHNWTSSEILLVTLICTFLAWYLHFLWGRRKLYLYSRKVAGPMSLPLIGSALRFVGSPYDVFDNLMKMFDYYPGIFRIWFGPRLFYIISEPRYYEILLTRCLAKEKWYSFGEAALGHGLITAPLDKWKKHRKMILPTFKQKILDGFVGTLSEQCQILVEQMRKIPWKEEIDVFDLMSKCIIDMICETAMGVKVNNQITSDRPVSRWLDRILENIFLRSFVFYYHFDVIFNMTARSKDYRTTLKNFRDFSISVIKEKRRLLEKNKSQPTDAETYVETRKEKIFLDHLMEISTDENQYTEQEVIDEVSTIVVAASDTTASAVSFALIMLGVYKDLQEKVYEEIIEVVGPSRAVEKEDLPKLQYTERCIKETLRLFPPGGAIVRAVEEDVDLGDQMIPEGASVIFGIITTHRSEKYWPDPFKFDPDRFLPEEVEKRHPCAFLPFSYGPRNCIGFMYSIMSMKIILSTVLREFKVSTSYTSVQDIELKGNIVFKPRQGYKLSLEPR